ncbi:MAG: hypothetical protein D6776_06155 [Planctomycetota bacterium]|nr:MAG: hypothetical protein D6776_06155 [Planctomycetota bacterium]
MGIASHRGAVLGGVLLLALVATAGGCQTVSRAGAQRSAALEPLRGPQGERKPGERPVFPDRELAARGYETLWDFYLGEPITGAWILDRGLYLYTADAHLWAVDLADGRVTWKWDVPGGLSYAPGSYTYREGGLNQPPELVVVAKDVLWVIDRNVGDPMWSLRLPFAASCPPVVSESHIYVGSWDGRIYAISKEDRRVTWSYRTGGAITARPAVAERTREALLVGSEDGVVYGLSLYADERKWSVPTLGAITAGLLNHKTYCYVASRDMNLYRIRIEDGLVDWRYAAGAVLTQSPVAFGRKTVLQVTGDHDLLSLDPTPAARRKPLRWSAPDVSRFIAKTRSGVLAEATDGTLVLLADDTGERRWDSGLQTGADVTAVNPYSPKSRVKDEARIGSTVVLGYRDGWVVALREKRAAY